MPKYLIAGIYLSITYLFDDYLGKRLEPYSILCDNPVEHEMHVHRTREMNTPRGLCQTTYENRHLYIDENGEAIVSYEKESNQIKSLLQYDLEYKRIDFYFNPDFLSAIDELEYIWTGLMFLEIASYHHMMALHASAVSLGREAILFSAPSTTGKSTHANLWVNHFSNARIINDDKPLLKVIDERLYVVGTPWSGKSAINENSMVPLKAIVFLSQSSINQVKELDSNQVLVQLMRNCHRPRGKDNMSRVMEVIEKIIQLTPVVEYECNISEEAVVTIYNHLFGGNQ